MILLKESNKMKKLLNQTEHIMDETILGFVLANQKRIAVNEGTHQVVRKVPKEKGKVKMVIGNGGGHEPNQLGLIGYGMYDMDCLGDVFTAQSAQKFFEGICAIDDGSPILMIIANHDGDVLNGNMAYAMAVEEDIDIKKVVFYEDVASAPKGEEEKRRGMAGLLFGVKITGAAAEEGWSMDECIRVFEKSRDNTRTYGFTLIGGTHPMTGLTMLEVPEDRVEMGGGIHGEGGGNSIEFTTSKDIARAVCDKLIEDMPFVEGDEVVLFVNGSGGTTLMELSIFTNDAAEYLKEKGIKIYDAVTENLITVQEQSGGSISLFKLDDEMKKLWDAPCSTPTYTNL